MMHKAPLFCKIAVRIVGVSPHGMFSWCTLGLNAHYKCVNCECNIPSILAEGFEEGLSKYD